MLQRFDGSDRTRFDEAVDRAVQAVNSDLQGGRGALYQVIPFAAKPLERATFTSGPETPEQERVYLQGFRPKDPMSQSALWDTIQDLAGLIRESGPNTAIRLCSDGEDTFSVHTKAEFLRRLDM
jgi:hypothetical protein